MKGPSVRLVKLKPALTERGFPERGGNYTSKGVRPDTEHPDREDLQ